MYSAMVATQSLLHLYEINVFIISILSISSRFIPILFSSSLVTRLYIFASSSLLLFFWSKSSFSTMSTYKSRNKNTKRAYMHYCLEIVFESNFFRVDGFIFKTKILRFSFFTITFIFLLTIFAKYLLKKLQNSLFLRKTIQIYRHFKSTQAIDKLFSSTNLFSKI